MAHPDIIRLLIALGILLASARILGEIAVKLKQPMFLGEILAGLLLGPSLLGHFLPDWQTLLFPPTGPVASTLEGFFTIAIVFFMLVAGMELDLRLLRREGKIASAVGLLGIFVPFLVGFFLAWGFPGFFGNSPVGRHPLIFPIFFAVALSISALPFIAKVLADLRLQKTEVGDAIVSSAMVNNLSTWLFFAFTLSLFHTGLMRPLPTWITVLITLSLAIVLLTLGRMLVRRIFPLILVHFTWPGGAIGFVIGLTFFGAALTEWIGIHSLLGALLVGAALSDSPHLRTKTRSMIQNFALYIFAPIFFASVGLRVDLLKNFDLPLTIAVFLIASASKILACGLGAWFAGASFRESLAVGFGMNARGSMEILLSFIALRYGLIQEKMFIALMVMALATSVLAAPAIKFLLGIGRVMRFYHFMGPKLFLRRLKARSVQEVALELAAVVAKPAGLDREKIAEMVTRQEKNTPTGLEHHLAIPHLQIPGIKRPIVAAGLSERGIDFHASDGKPAHLIFLVLTPEGKGFENGEMDLALLEEISDTFGLPQMSEQCLEAANYTEFLAVVKTASAEHG